MSREGRFVWFELMTTDTAAAPAFYAAVANLKTQAYGEHAYTMWVGEAGPVGGMMTLPEQAKAMGAPPHWLGYVKVQNVADIATRVTDLGGKVYVGPSDMGENGSFAILADPQGATFGVHAGGAPDTVDRTGKLGEFGWSELGMSDPDAAWAFYSQLFGWVKTGSMEMGPGMTYQMFGKPGGPDIGGMMKSPPGAPGAFWQHYCYVADCEASFATAIARGGNVLYPPMDIPGGGKAALISDPQGAVFGLVSSPKA